MQPFITRLIGPLYGISEGLEKICDHALLFLPREELTAPRNQVRAVDIASNVVARKAYGADQTGRFKDFRLFWVIRVVQPYDCYI